jgi:DtxR family transcriptional regulator, Mn-dependent transcriptional regulator
MSPDSPNLSRSVEDYLKAIWSLAERGEATSTSNIASALEVQPASVSGMVKRLAEAGWVEHLRYRGVTLTDEGNREALRIVRRHRVLETYLSRRLGYSWDDVHDEAERLEHAASDALIDRMAAALEHPSEDPHGAPIPSRSGEVEPRPRMVLVDALPGSDVVIRAVRDDDPERLRAMEARGLLPGVRLHVEGRSMAGGPLGVRVGGPSGEPQAIGPHLAGRIWIEPAEETRPQPSDPVSP